MEAAREGHEEVVKLLVANGQVFLICSSVLSETVVVFLSPKEPM